VVVAPVVAGRIVGAVTGVMRVMPAAVAVVVNSPGLASGRRLLLHKAAVVVAHVVANRIVGAVLGGRHGHRGGGQSAGHAYRGYDLSVSLGHGFSFAGSGPCDEVGPTAVELSTGPWSYDNREVWGYGRVAGT
jgi:hypothetical protein